ncbi:Nramp family divalent metal transporter [Asticcacaulis sp. EMRT-3]|uniref:Nramp family divalent metal transporter n=1 Tax=Asticcacaulis sp. EMRT-3 TaxID=3040349 RepID=UPI0024AF096B|nr:Nramp family divalent metal transporter [Asticcacaulis sp. EMRT-3]MDI7774021.1 Nramp family divalent metal transporter [Asticcacaulis sp. EMRT-3]
MSDSPKSPPAKGFMALLKSFGPGLVTGASDDDPSGIATYSQAGAQFGLLTLWTALVTFPLMAAVQEMCARIGLVTQQGLTGILRRHYPRPVLWLMVIFSFPAIVLNIGADIAGMGAVAHLVAPQIPALTYSVGFTGVTLLAIIWLPYAKFAAVLKWLCAVLLVYLVVPFLVKTDWPLVLHHTFVPTLHFDAPFVAMLVAILGTTISPYLFFWQATMEVEASKTQKRVRIDKHDIERMGFDVDFGMLFSNIVMFFIILTAGTVLFNAGIHRIDTVEQAAQALKPLAGPAAYYLFAIGIIGTGFLAIPVLAGSLSYLVAEAFDWQEGLDRKMHEAPAFYAILVVAMLIGLGINYTEIGAVRALIWSATLYGLTAPVIIAIVLHISNNKKVMGDYTNGVWSNLFGGLAFLLMTVAAVVMLWLQFS